MSHSIEPVSIGVLSTNISTVEVALPPSPSRRVMVTSPDRPSLPFTGLEIGDGDGEVRQVVVRVADEELEGPDVVGVVEPHVEDGAEGGGPVEDGYRHRRPVPGTVVVDNQEVDLVHTRLLEPPEGLGPGEEGVPSHVPHVPEGAVVRGGVVREGAVQVEALPLAHLKDAIP
jgi:hypothetical protein